MNIIEAIKSGRPFRRPDRHGWIEVHDNGLRWVNQGGITITLKDILADDWEIQEPSVTITANQFWNAIHDLYRKFPDVLGVDRPTAERLAGLLGLGPK